jgi:cysteine desulfurase
MSKIYLDYAAATPMKAEVIEAMRPFFAEQFYNPSAIYLPAKAVRRQLEDLRAQAARLLGARPAEIIFTAGATEANNLAIQGIKRQFPDGEMLYAAVEHDSVIAPAVLAGGRPIPVDSSGRIILNKLSNLITDKTVLISIGLVNNELGTIQPLAEAAKLAEDVRRRRLESGNQLPLYLHTDAAQAGNYLDLHTSRLGVDLMSLNGGKLYGPKQSGALYVKAGTKLQPLIVGGGQEFGLRSGTENLAAIAGFTKALEMAQAGRSAENRRISRLRQDFESLVLADYPAAFVNGPAKHRSPHISSLTLPEKDNERLIMELDEQGIQCAAGSACSAASDEPSHVLRAIGISEEDARSSLRFSFGADTDEAAVKQAAEALSHLLADR